MKANILLLYVIMTFFSCTQKRVLFKEVTKAGGLVYYNSKPFTGILFDVYYEGKVELEEEYKDGKRDGKQIFYFEDGKIERITTYKDDSKTGEYKLFDKNGNLEESGNYKEGNKDGEWIECVNCNFESEIKDTVYVKGLYLNEKRNGIFIYYTNSNPEFKKIDFTKINKIDEYYGDIDDGVVNPIDAKRRIGAL